MLVNLNDVLIKAKNNKYAVGLFNAISIENARAIIHAAEETNSPVIIGTAEVFNGLVPMEEVAYFLLPMAKKSKVPVVLHLDHGLTRQACLDALEMGFTSIMYDCSMDLFEDNIKKVAEMAKVAHGYGATIEGELGHVGNNEDSVEGEISDHSLMYTDPDVAAEFVKRTQIDALAIAVGTAHGTYTLPPKLDFDRIEKIAGLVGVPLVLHGGSGLTDEDFREAIHRGIAKINIFTDLNVAGARAVKETIDIGKLTLTDFTIPIYTSVKEKTIEKMKLFNSYGNGVL
jgi:fructose-bisphosphate aldolase class II